MIDLIKSIPNYSELSAKEICSVLNELHETPTHEKLTWQNVGDYLTKAYGADGIPMIDKLRVTLDEVGFGWVNLALSSSIGLDVSNPFIQASLVALEQSLPFAKVLRERGSKSESLWSKNGNEGEATVDAVESALFEIKLAIGKQQKEDKAVDRLQAYREWLASWDGLGEERQL